MKNDNLCPDCAAKPGQYHHIHCDVASCITCGAQALMCSFEDEDHVWYGQIWSGRWPGLDEIDEGLATDLNDLAVKGHSGQLTWNGQRWVKNPIVEDDWAGDDEVHLKIYDTQGGEQK